MIMRTVILYESKFGNTAHIASAIAEDCKRLGPVTLSNVQDGMPNLDNVGLLIVCGPTQGHNVSLALRTMLDNIPSGYLHGIAAAAFDTRVAGPKWLTGSASKGIAQRLQRKGARLVAPNESFIVKGSEGPVVDEDLARAHIWAGGLVDALASSRVGSASAF
jgi:flavodoxin